MTDNPQWCAKHQTVHTAARACTVSTAGWVAAGQVDVAVLVDAAAKAAKGVDPMLGPELVTVLDRIATYADPTPLRAASTAPSGVQPMWCEDHGCDTRECPKVEGVMVCKRTFEYAPGADPTGEAVMSDVLSDATFEGIADRARVLDLLRLRVAVDRELVALAAKHASRRPSGKLDVDPEWCISCQRAGDPTSPVYLGSDKRPRYRANGGGHLCSWCGGFKSDYHVEPPVHLVRRHVDGRTVPEKEIKAWLATQPKPKRKRRR